MKNKGVFVTATVLALGIFFIARLSRPRDSAPNAILEFAGFTNTPQRTEALFWFTNLNRAYLKLDHGWNSALDLSRWTPTGWVEEAQAEPSYYSSRYNGRELIGVPVATTNVPMRVTLHYQELFSRSQRLRTWWAEVRANAFTTNKVEYTREWDRYVTAETVVTGQSP